MKPRIFISSTFYDLKYIREDLANFIKSHDFEPILFEDGDIGYKPGQTLDISCYEAMRSSDMVILIIGGNYGSAATGEDILFNDYVSVTRKEFRTAIDTGIPVIVFVEQGVYYEYGIYEINCNNIDYGNTIINFKMTKNCNVFKFIKEIKGIVSIPILEFSKTTTIKEFLSKQWSDMFKNYLAGLREHKQIERLQDSISGLTTIIEQMRVMMDSVGKKLFSNDEMTYLEIINKQQSIQLRNICDLIESLLKCNIIIKDKYENVLNLLKSIVMVLILLKRRNIDELSQEDKNDVLGEINYWEIFKNNNINPTEINPIYFVYLTNYLDIINDNQDILIDMIINNYYDSIFRVRKTNQELLKQRSNELYHIDKEDTKS